MDRESSLSNAGQSLDADPTSPAEEFLKLEYELLNQWAVHGENVTHRIFNFYITVLTAILGGLLVTVQALSLSIHALLLIVAGASGFLLLIGIVFFDALVSQHIRNVYYYVAMQSIRAYFQHYQKVSANLLELQILSFDKESVASRLVAFRFGFPGGNQLTLIGAMNSLMVAVVICSLLWGIAGVGFRLAATLLASIACALIALAAHRMLADLMIGRNMARITSDLSTRKVLRDED